MDWAKFARCRGADPAMFFPVNGSYHKVEKLKAYCEPCPVREQCAEWGIRHEHLGVWGGLSGKDRELIRRERGIQCSTPGANALNAYWEELQRA